VTTVILLRHAHSVANEKGILAGRASGVSLSTKGKEQAELLTSRLGNARFKDIRISPLERCLATLEPWLQSQDTSVRKKILFDPNVSEVDYGDWTGKKLLALSLRKEWRVVQNTPSEMKFPKGEGLLQMQQRAEKALRQSIKKTGTGVSLIVSHGDVIKSLIATALDLHLDKFQKIVIDPASISVLDFNKGSFRLLHLNDLTTNFEYLSQKKRSSKTLVGGGSGSK
jgi:probable phosphomutase (TIGR03848 family)